MHVTEKVHRIRIDFQVTETVRRFVYVYLITGNACYLIDSGVAGSEKIIEAYMRGIGRRPDEIKAIFLTHAHPDHIGGAASIKERTNCKIYCSGEEQAWVQDLKLQFRERPIPNFYQLAGQSVPVDQIVRDGDKIVLEKGIELEVIGTAGHSKGDISYNMNGSVLFCGDAIPTAGDFPILVDIEKSIQTLDKINACVFTKCCPAWDCLYEKKACADFIQNRKELLFNLQRAVEMTEREHADLSEDAKVQIIAKRIGVSGGAGTPLFAASAAACRQAAGHGFFD